MQLLVEKSHLLGTPLLPTSKSYAIRWILLSLVLDEVITLEEVNFCSDVKAALAAVESFGVKVKKGEERLILDGRNLSLQDEITIDAASSATLLRLIIPLGLCFTHRLIVKASPELMKRGIADYIHLLKDASIINLEDAFVIEGNIAFDYAELSLASSSQYASGLLLLMAKRQKGTIVVDYQNPYFGLTKDVLSEAGFDIRQNGLEFKLEGFKKIKFYQIRMKKDATLALYLEAFNLIGSEIEIKDDYFDLNYSFMKEYAFTKGIKDARINIDLAPLLFVIGSMQGGYVITHFDSLRNKESNRLEDFLNILEKNGAKYHFNNNSLVFEKSDFCALHFSHVDDHRLVFALMVILANYGGLIEGKMLIDKSYPDYLVALQALGLKFREGF